MKRLVMPIVAVVVLGAFIGCASAPDSTKASATPATAKPVADTPKPEAPKAEAPKAAPAAGLPAGELVLLDNFEEGNYWAAVGDSWDKWGSHNLSLEAEVSDKWGTDGSNSGDWVFDKIPAAGGQATFFSDQLVLTDWTGVKYVAIDINNGNAEPFKMCFSCQTTDGWKWTQTKAVEVPVGVSTVVFDLVNGIMDGGNTPVSAVPGIDQVKRAMFNVVGYGSAGGSGRFLADNIRLIK